MRHKDLLGSGLGDLLARRGSEALKKGFGQRTRRNNKYEKRAAARIALTCLIRQRQCTVVRNNFGVMQDFYKNGVTSEGRRAARE